MNKSNATRAEQVEWIFKNSALLKNRGKGTAPFKSVALTVFFEHEVDLSANQIILRIFAA